MKKTVLRYIYNRLIPKVGISNEIARQKWLKDSLRKVPSGAKLLDAGAGELKNKKYCEHLEYVSQDICLYDGVGNGGSFQTGSWNTSQIDIICDIADMPIQSDSFDVVLCSEVFEHVPDPVLVLEELARVLKPGGLLILAAPFSSLTHFAPYHFVTGFNRYWYEYHLKKLGFKVEIIQANGNFFEWLAQELHRLNLISEKYSKLNKYLITLSLLPVLWALKKMSLADRGSCELLCFGYHVKAIK